MRLPPEPSLLADIGGGRAEVQGRIQESVARIIVPAAGVQEGVVWGVPSQHTLQRGDVTPPGEGGVLI